jgi:hypothetical protein
MTNNLTCILTTTINIPYFLDNILTNLKRFKHKDVFVLVVTDKKTPSLAKNYCVKVSKKYKIRIDYFDIDKQKKFFKKYPKIFSQIPFNDAMRRLLGSIYLLKQKNVPERLIFIDDDNFVSNDVDFLKGHLIVGKKIRTKTVSNKINFPNLYKYIQTDEKLPLFPRGFPWSKRNKSSFDFVNKKIQNGKVLANCGYILGDPDIDAVSRLFWKIDIKNINFKKNFFLSKNNYFPFNDQNTAISKEFFKIYFKPISAGRNSDIWTSYLIVKIAHLHNDLISYGQPHLKQIRNIHDNWKDYELEKMHNISTDLFIEIIQKIKIKKNDQYYLSFVDMIKKAIFETNKRIKNNLKTKKIVNTRHYQAINSSELQKRNLISLKYILDYFKGYLKWLIAVKKI